MVRDVAYGWCTAHGSTSIGLDTAQSAEHLLAVYRSWGFVVVDRVQWPGKHHRSVVMARDLTPAAGAPDGDGAPRDLP